jgi:glycine cleavage system aminomethyltransferase T/glycine/D-amino acid oxidase-like deaminating enzyme
MSALPTQARVVIVGAGVVGNSLAWHLARLGWRDIVLLDKGPLPNPGGSTGHASSFTFPVEYSRQMTTWCMDGLRQFMELGVYTRSGGIEVARTETRMAELKRRLGAARAFGVDAELISPAEIKRLVPWIDERHLLGGFHTPIVGVVDPIYAGTLMRAKAAELNALTVSGMTEVTAIDVRDGRVERVRTDKGDIRTDTILVSCGVWSARVARMAGASIPLTPAVHQMISIGPVPRFADVTGEIAFPVIRDMDSLMYERQSGADLEIGSYAHRPILMEGDDIPSNEAAFLSPTEMPFTAEDFDPHMERALELFPDLVGDEQVRIRHAINGLISLTADSFPILGETPEVKGLWSAAAMWIKEAPSIARTVAEWMTDGKPEYDPSSSNIARFYDHQRTMAHVRARGSEWFPKFYGIVHPAEQWFSDRGVRLGPAHARHVALGAEFFEIAGWERPHWYGANEGLLEDYGDRVMPREAEWDKRWWSPIINAEHLALRDRVGLVENPAFAIFDVSGRGALTFLQHLAVSEMDVAIGRLVYTQLLNEAAGIKADLTVMRLARDHFRVVTIGFAGMSDKKWLTDHLPDDGSAQLHDATSAWTTVAIWGPRARKVVQSVTEADVSHAAFPFATCRAIDIGSIRALAARISYAGELGWEISAPIEQGARLWDLLWDAGQPFGVVAVGLGAYGTTLRLEKSYRAMGSELELDRNLVEAAMARPSVKDADFVGKTAYLEQRSTPPAAILCTLTVSNHASEDGVPRYMLGGEPVTTPDGHPLIDAKGRRSFVTSAGSGPSLGMHLLMAYLPAEVAKVGAPLAVEYFGGRYPVKVAVVGSKPLFDPDNARIRA